MPEAGSKTIPWASIITFAESRSHPKTSDGTYYWTKGKMLIGAAITGFLVAALLLETIPPARRNRGRMAAVPP